MYEAELLERHARIMRGRKLTMAQSEALKWLREHGGDGIFDRNGVLLAAGESAPHTRSTWNALAKIGAVEFYNPIGKGRGRLRLAKSLAETEGE